MGQYLNRDELLSKEPTLAEVPEWAMSLIICAAADHAVEWHEAEQQADICGLCGQPGADKIPHPMHWPGERYPETELVHAECERRECERAHAALSPEQREAVLRSIR